MSILVLRAPVSGPLVPIEDVPDPVFAGKLAGDGVSIDPVTSTLRAPCDAEVLFVHPSGHAVTLRTEHGIELILHIGLDTVTLGGEGFLPLTRKGARVRTGDPLIDFAPDYVATHAPSLLTEIVISNPDRVSRIDKREGYVDAGDVILEVAVADERSIATQEGAGDVVTSRELIVRDPTGLHARPAAVLASTARRFKADVRLRCGTREANVRSVTGIMGLEIAGGDRVSFIAAGPDARAVIDALLPLMEVEADAEPEGSGERSDAGLPGRRGSSDPTGSRAGTGASQATFPGTLIWSATAHLLQGVPASPGIAIGQVVLLGPHELPTIQPTGTAEEERQKLDRALAQARAQLAALSSPTDGSTVQAGIFRAHLELLEDPDLVEFSWELIASGAGAVAAWHRAFTRLAEKMEAARSEMFAQRATDLRDVGRRLLRLIAGMNGAAPSYPEDAIVVAHELTPSETATFDRTRVRGFCTVTGGKTSHVAILARAAGIPAIAGIDPHALQLDAGTRVILDGINGVLVVKPGDADVARAEAASARAAAQRHLAASAAREPALTLDGVHVEVAVNIGSRGEAATAAAQGADGVGLLRSEFLFLDRAAAPDEDEQYAAYAEAASAFGQKSPVIIRTLDVGGDKPLAYLPLPREENPFLGIRGIRLAPLRADLLRTQLRAILRAAEHGRVEVMFPMVATIEDWRSAKRLLDEERAALGVHPIPAGVMVEVPAVALTADIFAAEVDFFSIGTNDLSQYTLAMDRAHPTLAAQLDALHPAVLRLIELTTRAAQRHGRRVGVCGALAGEEDAVPILLGLGIDELSVSIPIVPTIKARVRTLRASDCRELAAGALAAASAADVRSLVRRSC